MTITRAELKCYYCKFFSAE